MPDFNFTDINAMIPADVKTSSAYGASREWRAANKAYAQGVKAIAQAQTETAEWHCEQVQAAREDDRKDRVLDDLDREFQLYDKYDSLKPDSPTYEQRLESLQTAATTLGHTLPTQSTPTESNSQG